MIELPLEKIDQIRKSGFRPQIIGVIVNNSRVLFCYKKEYDLWMFPQGGIDNKETIKQAFWREMNEELGEDFTTNCDRELIFVLKDKSKFQKDKQGSRPLHSDSGEDITLKGKVYFAIATKTESDKIDISKTEFDNYRWVNSTTAQEILDGIYQPSKKRIALRIIEKIKEMGLLR